MNPKLLHIFVETEGLKQELKRERHWPTIFTYSRIWIDLHERHRGCLELPTTQTTRFTAICNIRLRILCDVHLHTVLLRIICMYNIVLEYQRAQLSNSRITAEHRLSS